MLSNLVGKVTLEYTCSTVTSYYLDNLVAKNLKYEILKRDDNLIEIKYYSPPTLNETIVKRITLVNDCYYIPFDRFAFSEVFCRVK